MIEVGAFAVLELGNIFKQMCQSAPQGYQVTNIHLFCVQYASGINNDWYKISKIIKALEISFSYATKIRKGMKRN